MKLSSFEYEDFWIPKPIGLRIVLIYRPLSKPVTSTTQACFLDQFEDLVHEPAVELGKLLIAGHFNLHFENPSATGVAKLKDILSGHSSQMVT